MNYSATYKWHIDDATLISKILSAKNEQYFESDNTFQTGPLHWKVQLYPNGVGETTKGCCFVGARLLGMPSSWKSIFCQVHIECPQMQSKMVFSQSYCTPRGWRFCLSSFEDLKASCGNELTFIVTIRITRITLKEDNKILFQMQTKKHKKNAQLQWKIDEEMMKKLKSFDRGKAIYSDILNDIWCLRLYPNGAWNRKEGDVRCGLWLCGLPPNVSKMSVQWTVHCHEANIKKTRTHDFDEENRDRGFWHANTMSFAEFCKYDAWTVSVNVKVLKSEFKSNQVSVFLSDLGLEKYVSAFQENGFETIQGLKELTNDDLKELRVGIAHRKQIQNGITEYLTTHFHHKNNDESKENDEQIENEDITCDNPLVVCVGIAKYVKLKHLKTAIDVAMYRSLFEDKYGYKFIANDPSQPMNKQEMERFLRNARKVLYDFADDKLNYDALIVTFGGHGTSDSVICSDGSKYKHKAIRKMFFIDELKDIPKIFLIDACRTEDANEEEAQKARSTFTASTFSTTLMTSEGHEVYGAKICKFITGKLRDAYRSDQFTNFRTVYKSARTKIKQTTNNEQDLVLCEHDLDIDSVVFMPRRGRGTGQKSQVDGTVSVADDDLRTILGPQPDSKLDLMRYFSVLFNANYGDNESLCGLSDVRLGELGIGKAFHQKELLRRVKKLRNSKQ